MGSPSPGVATSTNFAGRQAGGHVSRADGPQRCSHLGLRPYWSCGQYRARRAMDTQTWRSRLFGPKRSFSGPNPRELPADPSNLRRSQRPAITAFRCKQAEVAVRGGSPHTREVAGSKPAAPMGVLRSQTIRVRSCLRARRSDSPNCRGQAPRRLAFDAAAHALPTGGGAGPGRLRPE
jgi:hypothetical protein